MNLRIEWITQLVHDSQLSLLHEHPSLEHSGTNNYFLSSKASKINSRQFSPQKAPKGPLPQLWQSTPYWLKTVNKQKKLTTFFKKFKTFKFYRSHHRRFQSWLYLKQKNASNYKFVENFGLFLSNYVSYGNFALPKLALKLQQKLWLSWFKNFIRKFLNRKSWFI